MIPVSKLTEWAVLAATAIGGGVWVGSIDTKTVATDAKIESVSQTVKELGHSASQLAILTERSANMQDDIREMKEQQKEILSELRKK